MAWTDIDFLKAGDTIDYTLLNKIKDNIDFLREKFDIEHIEDTGFHDYSTIVEYGASGIACISQSDIGFEQVAENSFNVDNVETTFDPYYNITWHPTLNDNSPIIAEIYNTKQSAIGIGSSGNFIMKQTSIVSYASGSALGVIYGVSDTTINYSLSNGERIVIMLFEGV